MLYNYETFIHDADTLVEKIKDRKKEYAYVVGVTRGGLIPAVYISHRLGIPMETLKWTNLDDNVHEDNKKIKEDLANGADILLVDDIIDSGETITQILEDWSTVQQNPRQVHVASLITNVALKYKPKFYARPIDRNLNKSWIEFWWEA